MSGFIRTTSGLKNYSKFFGVDVTVFIEGKKNEGNLGCKTPDQLYYEVVSNVLAPEKKFKFKVLGNKHSVLKHAEIISRSHGNVTALAIVDKDFDSLKLSFVRSRNLHYTHYYSWENDLLNLDLSLDVISDLTPLTQDLSRDAFTKRFINAKKRIEFISTLDAVLQINSETIIAKRNNSCGVALSDTDQVVKLQEIKRLTRQYRSHSFTDTSMASQLLAFIKTHKLKQHLVQGHLWCFTIKKMIADIYKKLTNQKSITTQSIYSLLLSKFASNPIKYMSTDVQQHYRSIFN